MYLGVCVTYRWGLDWWPDLLHIYTYHYTSQTTIWHTMSSLLHHFRLPSQKAHSIIIWAGLGSLSHSFEADTTENFVSIVIAQNISIVTFLFVAAGNCIPSRCLVMNVYFGSAIPAFRRHVTICMYNKDCSSETCLGTVLREGADELNTAPCEVRQGPR
jgi:hypothetical protein